MKSSKRYPALKIITLIAVSLSLTHIIYFLAQNMALLNTLNFLKYYDSLNNMYTGSFLSYEDGEQKADQQLADYMQSLVDEAVDQVFLVWEISIYAIIALSSIAIVVVLVTIYLLIKDYYKLFLIYIIYMPIYMVNIVIFMAVNSITYGFFDMIYVAVAGITCVMTSVYELAMIFWYMKLYRREEKEGIVYTSISHIDPGRYVKPNGEDGEGLITMEQPPAVEKA